MRQNWKWLAAPMLLAALLFFAPGTSQGQRFGGRGGGFSADSAFDRLLQSYGGSGDTLDYARIPAEQRERNNRFAQMSGSPPMPTSGTISREQFRGQFEQRMQEMRSRMGSFGRRGGDSGDRSSPFSRGGPPGMGGGSSSDFADSIFKRSDRNGDGRITPDEASSRMRDSFQQYDTNRDGSIDTNEFRGYMQARFGSRGGSSDSSSSSLSPPPFSPGGNWDPRGNNDRRDRRNRDDRNDSRNGFRGPNQPQEDAMPVVYRYGKLPKEFPFTDLDTDKDGQIGLYEWRHAEKSIKEFTELDLNGDGYLTADEWLRTQRLAAEKKAASGDPTTATSTSTSASTSRGGPPFGGNMRGMGRNRGVPNGGDRTGRNGGGRGNRRDRGDRNSSSRGGQ
jgi:Ca2+-binding EF-hand superfamily protein